MRDYWNGQRTICPFCNGTGIRRHAAPLTQVQATLYRFISEYKTAHGWAPSFDEIADHFEYRSLATVHEHLQNLERKGYVTRSPNEARAIICLVPLDELGGTPAVP